MTFRIGDVVRVTRMIQRGVKAKGRDIYRVLYAYQTKPVTAVITGWRHLQSGIIWYKEEYTHEGYVVTSGLSVKCSVGVWLVRTGLMNREVFVPIDGVEAVAGSEADGFMELMWHRARGPAIQPIGNGVEVECKRE